MESYNTKQLQDCFSECSVSVASSEIAESVCKRANEQAYRHAFRIWPHRFSHGVFFEIEGVSVDGATGYHITPTCFEACSLQKRYDLLNDALRECAKSAQEKRRRERARTE